MALGPVGSGGGGGSVGVGGLRAFGACGGWGLVAYGAVWPVGLHGLRACGGWGPVGDHTAHNVPQMLHENKLPGPLQHSKQLQLVFGDLVGL